MKEDITSEPVAAPEMVSTVSPKNKNDDAGAVRGNAGDERQNSMQARRLLRRMKATSISKCRCR